MIVFNFDDFSPQQCGNYGILLPPFFRKNSVNVTFYYLKNFTLNWFDEKNLHGSEFFVFPHCAQCGKTKNLVSPRKYPKKFRQIWWKNSLLLFSNFSVIQFHELWQIKEEKKSFWDAFSSFSSYSYYLCHRNFLTSPLWYFFTSSISNKGPITNSFES